MADKRPPPLPSTLPPDLSFYQRLRRATTVISNIPLWPDASPNSALVKHDGKISAAAYLLVGIALPLFWAISYADLLFRGNALLSASVLVASSALLASGLFEVVVRTTPRGRSARLLAIVAVLLLVVCLCSATLRPVVNPMEIPRPADAVEANNCSRAEGYIREETCGNLPTYVKPQNLVALGGESVNGFQQALDRLDPVLKIFGLGASRECLDILKSYLCGKFLQPCDSQCRPLRTCTRTCLTMHQKCFSPQDGPILREDGAILHDFLFPNDATRAILDVLATPELYKGAQELILEAISCTDCFFQAEDADCSVSGKMMGDSRIADAGDGPCSKTGSGVLKSPARAWDEARATERTSVGAWEQTSYISLWGVQVAAITLPFFTSLVFDRRGGVGWQAGLNPPIYRRDGKTGRNWRLFRVLAFVLQLLMFAALFDRAAHLEVDFSLTSRALLFHSILLICLVRAIGQLDYRVKPEAGDERLSSERDSTGGATPHVPQPPFKSAPSPLNSVAAAAARIKRGVEELRVWNQRVFGLRGRFFQLKLALVECLEITVQLVNILTQATNTEATGLILLISIVALNLIVTPLLQLFQSKTIYYQTAIIFEVVCDLVYLNLNLFLFDEAVGDALSALVATVLPCALISLSLGQLHDSTVADLMNKPYGGRRRQSKTLEYAGDVGVELETEAATKARKHKEEEEQRRREMGKGRFRRYSRTARALTAFLIAGGLFLFFGCVPRLISQNNACSELVGEELWEAVSPKYLLVDGLFGPTGCNVGPLPDASPLQLDPSLASLLSPSSAMAPPPQGVQLARVTELSGLKPSLQRIPETIGMFPALKTLDVRGTQLSSSGLPLQLLCMPSLREVLLDGTEAALQWNWSGRDLEANALEVCSGAREALGLSSMGSNATFSQSGESQVEIKITDLLHASSNVEWMALALRGVQAVNLSSCNLASLPPATLGLVPMLQSLDLSWNRLKRLPNIRANAALETLHVGHNGISRVDWEAEVPPSIRSLGLQNNSFSNSTQAAAADASRFDAMLLLDLRHNNLTELDPVFIAGAFNNKFRKEGLLLYPGNPIAVLNLSKNNALDGLLTPFLSEQLRPSVRELVVSFDITDPREFATYPKLEKLVWKYYSNGSLPIEYAGIGLKEVEFEYVVGNANMNLGNLNPSTIESITCVHCESLPTQEADGNSLPLLRKLDIFEFFCVDDWNRNNRNFLTRKQQLENKEDTVVEVGSNATASSPSPQEYFSLPEAPELRVLKLGLARRGWEKKGKCSHIKVNLGRYPLLESLQMDRQIMGNLSQCAKLKHLQVIAQFFEKEPMNLSAVALASPLLETLVVRDGYLLPHPPLHLHLPRELEELQHLHSLELAKIASIDPQLTFGTSSSPMLRSLALELYPKNGSLSVSISTQLALRNILSELAPSLESLVLLGDIDQWLQLPPDTEFPNLRSLTLSTCLSTFPAMPALTKLSMACNTSSLLTSPGGQAQLGALQEVTLMAVDQGVAPVPAWLTNLPLLRTLHLKGALSQPVEPGAGSRASELPLSLGALAGLSQLQRVSFEESQVVECDTALNLTSSALAFQISLKKTPLSRKRTQREVHEECSLMCDERWLCSFNTDTTSTGEDSPGCLLDSAGQPSKWESSHFELLGDGACASSATAAAAAAGQAGTNATLLLMASWCDNTARTFCMESCLADRSCTGVAMSPGDLCVVYSASAPSSNEAFGPGYGDGFSKWFFNSGYGARRKCGVLEDGLPPPNAVAGTPPVRLLDAQLLNEASSESVRGGMYAGTVGMQCWKKRPSPGLPVNGEIVDYLAGWGST